MSSRIRPDEFVRVWMEAVDNGDKISWIAHTLKVSDQTVHGLARALRRAGVDLPPIRRKFVEIANVDDLNKLIRSKFNGAA